MNWFSIVRRRDVVTEIVKNYLMMVPSIRAARIQKGRTAALKDPMSCADFAIRTFAELSGYLGGYPKFEERDVLEIGPGDIVPLGMLAIGAGARRYIALDRFLGDIGSDTAKEIYETVGKLSPVPLQAKLPDVLLYPLKHPSVRLIRESIESVNECGIADIVFSYNVLEHLFDLPKALQAMRSILRRNGIMVHRIDYSPHDVWRSYPNPLTFLTIPNGVWNAMGSARGTPNRLRHSQVITMMENAGFCTNSFIVDRFQPGDIREIERILLPNSRKNIDDVASAIVVASLAE
jgi:SAM-dependent methyltransferase